jgi:hypothetical protein
MKQIKCAIAVLVMTLAYTVAGAQSHPLKFNDMPLVGAVAIFANVHNIRYEWDVTPPNTPFTGDLTQDSPETGLAKLLDPNYRFEPKGNVYHITSYDRQGQSAVPRSSVPPRQMVQPYQAQQMPGGPHLVQNPIASIPVGMEQPYLEYGDPDYWFSPNIHGGEWLDGTTGLPPGWYKKRGRNTWAPFAYHPNDLMRMSPITRQRLATLLFAPSYAIPPGAISAGDGFGIQGQIGVGVLPNGPVLQGSAMASAYLSNGYGYGGGYGSFADSGWYGLPLFDFQLEEMRQQYKDFRRLAKLKVKGENCDNECLRNIHILQILTDQQGNEKEFYLASAAAINSWHEDGADVPINVQTNSAHLVIVNESPSAEGTMRGVDRNMILMPRAVRDDDTELTITPEMFTNARKIRILKQQVLWETESGKFEARPEAKPTTSNTQARAALP